MKKKGRATMKRMTNKAKIYEIIYNVLRIVIYFAVAGVGIAYLVFLFMGQDNRVLLHIEIILMLVVSLLWQADILIRKKLYKSNFVNKRDKKHTVAACVALVGGTIAAVSYALMAFCKVSGAFTFAMAIITGLAILATAAAFAVEHSESREIKTEEANKDNPKENITETEDEPDERQ